MSRRPATIQRGRFFHFGLTVVQDLAYKLTVSSFAGL